MGLRDYAFPIFLLILVNACFSGYQVLSALAFKSGASPLVFAFVRDVIASSLFIPTLYIVESRLPAEQQQLWPHREHAFYFFLLGVLVFGTSVYSALAIKSLSAAVYGLLTPTAPVFTILISWIVGVEVFNPRAFSSWAKVLGILLSVGGALLLVFSPSHSSPSNDSSFSILGLVYILGHKVCSGSYPILQKWVLAKFGYPSLTVAAWSYTTGAFLVGLSVTTGATPSYWDFSPITLGALAFSSVFAAYFNYYAMAWVNSITAAWFVISFYPLQSILTTYLSALFLGTDVGPFDFLGGGVVILGLFFCIGGQILDGTGFVTGKVEIDRNTEAATLSLTVKDLEELVEAERGGVRIEEYEEGSGDEGVCAPPLVLSEEERNSKSQIASPTRPLLMGTLPTSNLRVRAQSQVLPILHRAFSRSSLRSLRVGSLGGQDAESVSPMGSRHSQFTVGEDTPILACQQTIGTHDTALERPRTTLTASLLQRAKSLSSRSSTRFVGGLA